MPRLSKKEITALAVFFLVLVSIPISFSLVKSTQIFKSRASEGTKTPTLQTVTQPHEVPATSPLADLKKQLESSSPISVTPAPSDSSAANLAFGPTLNFKIVIEGRPVSRYEGKVFVGIIAGPAAANPKYLLTFTVDMPSSGIFNGLSLAGLSPGSSYTAIIKGAAQIAAASAFVMTPNETNLNNGQPLNLLTGDLNDDNVINSADLAIAKAAYGATPSSPNWSPRADFNMDGVINNFDLAYIMKNFGQSGDSGAWYSPPPSVATAAGGLSGGVNVSTPHSTPSGGYWMWIPSL